MTLGIYSNASPMATLEGCAGWGEPLRVLLLALSFRDDLRELWSRRRDFSLLPLRPSEALSRLGGTRSMSRSKFGFVAVLAVFRCGTGSKTGPHQLW
jgi:hypothetical protein